MRDYLLEDLRLDSHALQGMDLGVFRECAEAGYKVRHLGLLLAAMETLQ